MRLVTGHELIERERKRQVIDEAFVDAHDDVHTNDELVLAAVQYALPEDRRSYNLTGDHVPIDWPWEDGAFKPTPDDRVRELVKAGALLAAEIDRLIRGGAPVNR